MNFVVINNGKLMAAGNGLKIGKNNNILYSEFISVHDGVDSISIGANFCFLLMRNGRLKYIGMNDYIISNPILSFLYADILNYLSVYSGFYHAIGIRSNFSLYSVGDNTYGQLGLGNTNNNYNFFQKIGTNSWVKASAGLFHSAGIDYLGNLYTWGGNSSGELGLGDTNTRLSPTIVPGGYRWVDVHCGNGFTIAIKDDLSIWGAGVYSRIGSGAPGYSKSFVQLISGKWKAISCGFSYTIGIKTDGTMYSWGSTNHRGQLGNGTYGTSGSTYPVQIGVNKKWANCLATKLPNPFSYAISDDGELYVWGDNLYGELGINSSDSFITSPTYAMRDCFVKREIV